MMTTSIADSTLAELVNRNSDIAVFFEQNGIDYCCKGRRKLADVIGSDEQLAGAVKKISEIIAGNPSGVLIDEHTSLSQVIDYILEKHHRYVKDVMPLILQRLEKVNFKHGERFPVIGKVLKLFRELNIELIQHMFKEEMVLFPAIKNLEAGKDAINVSMPIQVMMKEHDVAGDLMHQIHELTNNYHAPDDACMTFRMSYEELKKFEADLHRHVHLENNVLFPGAEAILTSRSNMN